MTATDPLSIIVKDACQAAIRETLNISDISPRRLMTIEEGSVYLALSRRELYNMIANRELVGVRHGRRLMLDIRDLDSWISLHKDQ